MNDLVSEAPSAQLLVEFPFRVVFSALLALAGVCLYAFVPAMQTSPYVYVITLFFAFGLGTWGFRKLRLPAWGTDTLRAPILGLMFVFILVALALLDLVARALLGPFGR